MGFDGKQCIHPSQLATANTVFSPTDDEVAHARARRRGVRAGGGGRARRRGLDGKMIDEANVRMARVVLEQNQQHYE